MCVVLKERFQLSRRQFQQLAVVTYGQRDDRNLL